MDKKCPRCGSFNKQKQINKFCSNCGLELQKKLNKDQIEHLRDVFGPLPTADLEEMMNFAGPRRDVNVIYANSPEEAAQKSMQGFMGDFMNAVLNPESPQLKKKEVIILKKDESDITDENLVEQLTITRRVDGAMFYRMQTFWNWENFSKIEAKFDLSKYKEVLEKCIKLIDYANDKHFRHKELYQTINRVIKYTSGKPLIRRLNEQLIDAIAGDSDDLSEFKYDIGQLFEEFFYPYYNNRNEYSDHIFWLIDPVREGLKSNDAEYRNIAQKFLTGIRYMVDYLENLPHYDFDPNRDHLIEIISIFLDKIV